MLETKENFFSFSPRLGCMFHCTNNKSLFPTVSSSEGVPGVPALPPGPDPGGHPHRHHKRKRREWVDAIQSTMPCSADAISPKDVSARNVNQIFFDFTEQPDHHYNTYRPKAQVWMSTGLYAPGGRSVKFDFPPNLVGRATVGKPASAPQEVFLYVLCLVCTLLLCSRDSNIVLSTYILIPDSARLQVRQAQGEAISHQVNCKTATTCIGKAFNFLLQCLLASLPGRPKSG